MNHKFLALAVIAAAAEYTGEDGWVQLCDRDDINLV